MNYLVSIIVPIYNVKSFLEECIESLINQSYSNIEIILVNDGSTDDSKDICEKYKRNDKRIELYNKSNGGLSDARNYGIDRANGEYIVFVDSDDVVDRDYIKLLVENSINEKSDICICNYEKFTNNFLYNYNNYSYKKNIYLPIDYIKEMLCIKKNSYAWGTLIKKELFMNIRFKKGVRFEDTEMMYKLYIKSNKIVFIDLPLYKYRQQENSIVHKYNINN